MTTPSEDPPRATDFPEVPGALDNALAIVEHLRIHCPWDREQTAESLVPHLIEEAHETVDAIQSGDPAALRDELGDLLLNVAFQIVVAEEAGTFTRDDVVRVLRDKMIRRHPHLFGGEREPWEAIKARERSERADSGSPASPTRSAVEGLASGLDPLLRAHRIQERVSGVGFDWNEPAGALAKVREELDEVAAELSEGGAETDDGGGSAAPSPALAAEIGDLLFAVVNLSRLARVHAVTALASANVKFERRFRAVEALARERGLAIPGATLEEMDALWDEVKATERRGEPGERRGAPDGGAPTDQ